MPDFSLEAELWRAGYAHVAGVDEAGRGPLAGPVVAAAVILPHDWPREIPLDDSKRMSPAARAHVYEQIKERALAWRISAAPAGEIDRLNILRATLAAMARALKALTLSAQYVLVDGNQVPPTPLPCRAVVKGDGKSCSIAAASILAKVTRDRMMEALDARFPLWGFARHKGYPTREHRAALAEHGPSPVHRASFGWKRP